MAHEENLSDWQWRLMMSYVLRELKKLPDGVPDPQIYSYLSSGAPYSGLAIETISSLIKKSSDEEVSGIISKLESKDRLHGLFPNESKAWINTLVYTLTRGETQSRLSIVYALSGYGSKAVIAIPQLLNLLIEEDEDLREAVAQSFGRIVANPFANWNVFGVDEYKLEIDARIADSLVQVGINRQDIAEALTSVLESDESEEVQLASAISICQLSAGRPQAHEVILDHLTRSDGPHITILWALYSVSSKPQYLLPGLEFMLKHKQDYTSRAIKEAEEMKKLILESDSP